MHRMVEHGCDIEACKYDFSLLSADKYLSALEVEAGNVKRRKNHKQSSHL